LHLVGIVVAGRDNTAEDVAHLRLIIDQLEQGMAPCPLLADAEYVLGGGIQRDDEQVFVEQDDAGTQAVENIGCVAAQRVAAAGATRARMTRMQIAAV
jgi:hypothetical protein